jgi:pantetheine-phosphate adenylyltransferase
MTKIAIFPGSFDPFTKGHKDIVIKASKIFDKVIIGIGKHSSKKRYFNIELMTEKINQLFKEFNNVEVSSYNGLTAEFAKKMNARYIVRGLRNTTDFEYENAIAHGNSSLYPDLETIFLITAPELTHLSSTIARDIHKYGGDISHFLPYSL